MRKPARQPLDYVRKADTARPQSDGWSGATRQGGRESIQVVAGSRSHKPPSGRLGLMQVCSLLTCPDNERPRSKLRGIPTRKDTYYRTKQAELTPKGFRVNA
jgi:hypothetical protein